MKKKLKTIVLLIGVVTLCAVVWLSLAKVLNGGNSISKKLADLTTATPQQVTADRVAILTGMQKMSKLETAENNYEQVFQSSRDDTRWFGWCGEWLTFVAYGKVVAGIDLSKINESDISITSDTICITLPKAEVFNSILDEDHSYVLSHTSAIFSTSDKDMEAKVRQQATAAFEQYAVRDGILDNAYSNAADTLKQFVENIEKQNSAEIAKTIIFDQKAE
jgi:hypothetical protein